MVRKGKWWALAASLMVLSACSQSSDRFSGGRKYGEGDDVYTSSLSRDEEAVDVRKERVERYPLGESGLSYSKSQYSSPYRSPSASSYQSSSLSPPSSSSPPQWRGGAMVAPVPSSSYEPSSERNHGDQSASSPKRITVTQGQTVFSIARTHGVSVTALAQANGMNPPYRVSVGQSLVIPSEQSNSSLPASSQAGDLPFAQKNREGETAKIEGGTHKIQSGETLFSLGRTYHVSPYKIADLNGLPRDHVVRVGEILKIPGKTGKELEQKQVTQDQTPVQSQNSPQKEAKSETSPPAQQDSEPTASSHAEGNAATPPSPEAEKTAMGMDFRWPVRGKVISGFGQKANNTSNVGINIAVPEGTEVRAAEAGVVAQVTDKIKGYGNLVLIRHKDGWMTVYAHNKDILVKAGDSVKRGDIIARAGRTGAVTSPQVHFELRKGAGATAVDPMSYLSSATAAR